MGRVVKFEEVIDNKVVNQSKVATLVTAANQYQVSLAQLQR